MLFCGRANAPARVEEVRSVIEWSVPRVNAAPNCSARMNCFPGTRLQRIEPRFPAGFEQKPGHVDRNLSVDAGKLKKLGIRPRSGTIAKTANPGVASVFLSRTRATPDPSAPTYAIENTLSPRNPALDSGIDCMVVGGARNYYTTNEAFSQVQQPQNNGFFRSVSSFVERNPASVPYI